MSFVIFAITKVTDDMAQVFHCQLPLRAFAFLCRPILRSVVFCVPLYYVALSVRGSCQPQVGHRHQIMFVSYACVVPPCEQRLAAHSGHIIMFVYYACVVPPCEQRLAALSGHMFVCYACVVPPCEQRLAAHGDSLLFILP